MILLIIHVDDISLCKYLSFELASPKISLLFQQTASKQYHGHLKSADKTCNNHLVRMAR